jgi:hypothetical protein
MRDVKMKEYSSGLFSGGFTVLDPTEDVTSRSPGELRRQLVPSSPDESSPEEQADFIFTPFNPQKARAGDALRARPDVADRGRKLDAIVSKFIEHFGGHAESIDADLPGVIQVMEEPARAARSARQRARREARPRSSPRRTRRDKIIFATHLIQVSTQRKSQKK